jgi:hypothetical protein
MPWPFNSDVLRKPWVIWMPEIESVAKSPDSRNFKSDFFKFDDAGRNTTNSDRNSRQPTILLEIDHTDKRWNAKAKTLRSGGVWKEVASPTGFEPVLPA